MFNNITAFVGCESRTHKLGDMFSLRIAIIFALLTQFANYAVCGYTVAIPFTVDDPSSSDELKTPSEGRSPYTETNSNLVIESANAPTFNDQSSSVSTSQVSVVQQNSNDSGSPSTESKAPRICREFNPENGCFIKHFRQYNYYYTNGRHVTQNPRPIIRAEELFPSEVMSDVASSSSTTMTNNNGRVSVKTSSSSPTVRQKLPGVISRVPNNGFNYVQLSSRIRENTPIYGRDPTYDESSDNNEEPASSAESADQNTDPNPDDEPSESESNDENINEDIRTYVSEPNVFGHTRTRIVKTGNNRNFQSQQVSVSSRLQSKSGSEPQQQVSTTSGTQSQSLPGYGQAMNFAAYANFGGQNRMTVGYNPYFQPQPFGVSPVVQPHPPLPVQGFQNPIDFLGAPPAVAPIYQPTAFQYFNPVRTWPNIPPPSPLCDFANLSPSYSVIL